MIFLNSLRYVFVIKQEGFNTDPFCVNIVGREFISLYLIWC